MSDSSLCLEDGENFRPLMRRWEAEGFDSALHFTPGRFYYMVTPLPGYCKRSRVQRYSFVDECRLDLNAFHTAQNQSRVSTLRPRSFDEWFHRFPKGKRKVNNHFGPDSFAKAGRTGVYSSLLKLRQNSPRQHL